MNVSLYYWLTRNLQHIFRCKLLLIIMHLPKLSILVTAFKLKRTKNCIDLICFGPPCSLCTRSLFTAALDQLRDTAISTTITPGLRIQRRWWISVLRGRPGAGGRFQSAVGELPVRTLTDKSIMADVFAQFTIAYCSLAYIFVFTA